MPTRSYDNHDNDSRSHMDVDSRACVCVRVREQTQTNFCCFSFHLYSFNLLLPAYSMSRRPCEPPTFGAWTC